MTPELVDRFWSKVSRGDGCWVWLGGVNHYGYATFYTSKRTPRGAHRIAYQLLRGDIPDGLQIDHLCRNRSCVNPAHMEPVTQRENVLRGIGHTAVNARKTHCIHGHAFTPENTYSYRGRRFCRACWQRQKEKP